MTPLPAWSPEAALVHIGTLNSADKGCRGDSYEGHGLSVSECPDAWQAIAKLGGQPWWTLKTRSGKPARFLDWYETSERQRYEMLAWAANRSLVNSCAGYKLSWFDADRDDRVFTTFDDAARARAEFEAMRDEFDGDSDSDTADDGEPPLLEEFPGWKLTPAALSTLARKRADLDESAELCALLYVEAHPELRLDGLYWAHILDEAGLSAPCAVILPSRFPGYLVMSDHQGGSSLGWRPLCAPGHDRPEPGPASPRIDESPRAGAAGAMRAKPLRVVDEDPQLRVHDRILNFVSGGMPHQLREAIALEPECAALYEVSEDLEGTPLFHAADRCVLMARSGEMMAPAAHNFIECARLLLPYPCKSHLSTHGVATCFLDSDWSTSPAAPAVAELARDLIRVGAFDVSSPIPRHTEIEGLRPLAAAVRMGNPFMVTALLDSGCRLADIMEDFAGYAAERGIADVIDLARSFAQPNSGAVAARITERLLQERLDADAGEPGLRTAPPARRRMGV